MKSEKSLLQRLQSRISKRRNKICELNAGITFLVILKSLHELPRSMSGKLRQHRIDARDLGVAQRLDKELFQILLEKERNKYARHFRSKYLPVSRFNKGEPLVVTA